MSKHEQRHNPRDGVVWTPEQRDSYRKALIESQKKTNLRMTVAFALVIVASVVGAVLSGHEAGQKGAEAGRSQVVRESQKFARQYSTDQAERSRAACNRGKVDRTMIAKALRAQATYLNQVLDAESVKQDVKRAALKAQRSFNSSATDLESRTGTNLDCSQVFPFP